MSFHVPANTAAVAVKAGNQWTPDCVLFISTKRDGSFLEEEVAFKPYQKAAEPESVLTVENLAKAYSAAGYFGFLRGGYYLLVPGRRVAQAA